MKTQTPKEKAQELYDLMWHEIAHHNLHMTDINFIAKQCTLLAVDNLIELVNEIRPPKRFFEYYQEVKEEIQNL